MVIEKLTFDGIMKTMPEERTTPVGRLFDKYAFITYDCDNIGYFELSHINSERTMLLFNLYADMSEDNVVALLENIATAQAQILCDFVEEPLTVQFYKNALVDECFYTSKYFEPVPLDFKNMGRLICRRRIAGHALGTLRYKLPRKYQDNTAFNVLIGEI
ncbi:MAG: hypothetical protein LBK50_03330 [Candidatus Nomurabacteria bacterium]|jgi:hypothetical protein|nr:hypothetical protein [Candidatus Nomurabacteria bacterium]